MLSNYYWKKAFKFSTKTKENWKMIIEGIASNNNLDTDREIICPIVWTKSTLEKYKKKWAVILYEHNVKDRIWTALETSATKDWLFLKGEIEEDLDSYKVIKKIEKNMLKHFSVGFLRRHFFVCDWKTVKGEFFKEDGKDLEIKAVKDWEKIFKSENIWDYIKGDIDWEFIFTKKVDLFEISLVQFPANDNAEFEQVKALKSLLNNNISMETKKVEKKKTEDIKEIKWMLEITKKEIDRKNLVIKEFERKELETKRIVDKQKELIGMYEKAIISKKNTIEIRDIEIKKLSEIVIRKWKVNQVDNTNETIEEKAIWDTIIKKLWK